MNYQNLINAVSGVNRNRGIARIQMNRIARQMVDRLRAENPGVRNIGFTPD